MKINRSIYFNFHYIEFNDKNGKQFPSSLIHTDVRAEQFYLELRKDANAI